MNHNHDIAKVWSTDSTKHWHAASCGRAEHNEDVGEHTEDSGTVTKAVTITTTGIKTYKCTVCNGVARTEEIPELYSTPVTEEVSGTTYVYFGVWPQSVLPATSSVTVDETVSVTMGANTYYLGSDGNYYAKCLENSYDVEYKYTDGTHVKKSSNNSYRYFKVEPIKWRVLTNNYSGKKLLLAENILTANVPYYKNEWTREIEGKTVYDNNYKHSQIRAYLNGLTYHGPSSEVTKYNGNGFLQTAFTQNAQGLIAETVVDNRKETTGYSTSTYAAGYACENTTDKVFLLSRSEVINSDYGFAAYDSYGVGNARIRFPTDYAKANKVYKNSSSDIGGHWWLRSPSCETSSWARYVSYMGDAKYNESVNDTSYGVVPALSISF